MFIKMQATVVRPTGKGMFVGNINDVVECADDLAAELIDSGQAVEAEPDAPTAAKAKAGKPAKAKDAGAPAAEPAAGDEAPAA